MDILKDRALISVFRGIIVMHDLIQEMGKEIVRKECPQHPGKRSRLFNDEEICEVLRKNKGSDAIECISLSTFKVKEDVVHAQSFEKMDNLRMLRLYTRESNVSLESSLILPNLKRLDLSRSRKLTRIPDLSTSPNIEEINLSCCYKLIKVDSSIFLIKLSYLCLDFCDDLNSVNIPSNILCTSPGRISLSGCWKLNMFSLSEQDMIKEINSNNATDSEVFNSLSGLDLSHCYSLTIFLIDLSDMKFINQLCLSGCSKLENLPEIEDTLEDLKKLNLDGTAIQALPSSLCRLVGLEELSLRRCCNLEIIPSSIGTLTRLCKLDLTHCNSLQTFPSTIFNLKLKKLDLCGCSRLRTFPEITEPAHTFAHINLTCTAVKELPSSFGKLVNLRSLELPKCTDLESLPNSIVNLKHLSELDCSGCAKLTEIPTHIGRLTSLVELSLRDSGIVNLPESIGHLSRLKLLDLRDCKKLECIPPIPPFLQQLVALDCPSIRRVMPNSLVLNLSNSKEGVFGFYLTNAQQLDSGGRANIEEDARLRMTDDRYRSVFFCFPGSTVPGWFHFRGKGDSVTINEDLSFCSNDRLTGFALCVAFGVLDTNYVSRNGEYRDVGKDHTFVWKFNLESLSPRLCDARSFTFEISPYKYHVVTIKECGICPLYSKKKDDKYGGAVDIEQSSGSNVASR
ncbi:hypothetical protein ACSQ67_005280 [Phaseolus vulgaris]